MENSHQSFVAMQGWLGFVPGFFCGMCVDVTAFQCFRVIWVDDLLFLANAECFSYSHLSICQGHKEGGWSGGISPLGISPLLLMPQCNPYGMVFKCAL